MPTRSLVEKFPWNFRAFYIIIRLENCWPIYGELNRKTGEEWTECKELKREITTWEKTKRSKLQHR